MVPSVLNSRDLDYRISISTIYSGQKDELVLLSLFESCIHFQMNEGKRSRKKKWCTLHYFFYTIV